MSSAATASLQPGARVELPRRSTNRAALTELVFRAVVCVAGVLSVLVVGGAAARAPVARARERADSGGMLPKRCAIREPGSISPSSWPPARRELAPAGATAIRLCRYSGVNAPGLPGLLLVRSTLHDIPSLVSRMAREFDRLPAWSGALWCPADDGSEIIVLLAYPDRHAVTIGVGLTGCAVVTNGSLGRTAFGWGSPREFGPQLLAELERLTGYRGAGH